MAKLCFSSPEAHSLLPAKLHYTTSQRLLSWKWFIHVASQALLFYALTSRPEPKWSYAKIVLKHSNYLIRRSLVENPPKIVRKFPIDKVEYSVKC